MGKKYIYKYTSRNQQTLSPRFFSFLFQPTFNYFSGIVSSFPEKKQKRLFCFAEVFDQPNNARGV
jgi:hypothetical protein